VPVHKLDVLDKYEFFGQCNCTLLRVEQFLNCPQYDVHVGRVRDKIGTKTYVSFGGGGCQLMLGSASQMEIRVPAYKSCC